MNWKIILGILILFLWPLTGMYYLFSRVWMTDNYNGDIPGSGWYFWLLGIIIFGVGFISWGILEWKDKINENKVLTSNQINDNLGATKASNTSNLVTFIIGLVLLAAGFLFYDSWWGEHNLLSILTIITPIALGFGLAALGACRGIINLIRNKKY